MREPIYSNAFHARCLERFSQADWSCNGSLAPDEIREIFADMVRDASYAVIVKHKSSSEQSWWRDV